MPLFNLLYVAWVPSARQKRCQTSSLVLSCPYILYRQILKINNRRPLSHRLGSSHGYHGSLQMVSALSPNESTAAASFVCQPTDQVSGPWKSHPCRSLSPCIRLLLHLVIVWERTHFFKKKSHRRRHWLDIGIRLPGVWQGRLALRIYVVSAD